jgi:RNA 3'-terminal phosphate cyclase
MAGTGTFRTLPLTSHTTTNAEVIQQFLDVPLTMARQEDGSYFVSAGSAGERAMS